MKKHLGKSLWRGWVRCAGNNFEMTGRSNFSWIPYQNWIINVSTMVPSNEATRSFLPSYWSSGTGKAIWKARMQLSIKKESGSMLLSAGDSKGSRSCRMNLGPKHIIDWDRKIIKQKRKHEDFNHSGLEIEIFILGSFSSLIKIMNNANKNSYSDWDSIDYSFLCDTLLNHWLNKINYMIQNTYLKSNFCIFL